MGRPASPTTTGPSRDVQNPFAPILLLDRENRLMECAMQATENLVQSVGRAMGAGAALPADVQYAWARYSQAMELFVIRENPSLGRTAYAEHVSHRVESLVNAVGVEVRELPEAIQDAYEAHTEAMHALLDAQDGPGT